MPDTPRRRDVLRAGAVSATAALAGCSVSRWLRTDGRVDDWQFDPDTVESDGGFLGVSSGGSAQSAAGGGVGMAAGGAKDVANFRRNVEEGYLPIPTDLSYEGLFYEYYFETGSSGNCAETFCPTPAAAVAPDPLSGEREWYATVGLDSGLSAADFERKPLDLVVVLDVSGSMDSPFSRYYYDANGRGTGTPTERSTGTPPEDATKISVAAESIAAMTTHLSTGDRFGMVVFNDEAYEAKPVRAVEETDMAAIRGHIRELKAGGGTRMSAGMDLATELLDPHAGTDRADRETRMVFATDAMPNLGRTGENAILGTLEENAARTLYTTVVGIGVDFNSELVDAITAVEGANYFSVHSGEGFRRRMDREFEYWVSPLVFDLSVELDAAGYDLATVYGSTDAEAATDRLLHVDTLFPSPERDGKAKGGVVLARLAQVGHADEATVTAEWEHRDGSTGSSTARVTLPTGASEQFAHTGIRKAVLLARYASLAKNWMVYERRGPTGGADGEGGIDEPPAFDAEGDWERQSDPLTVSPAYRDRFDAFADHLEAEMAATGDETLSRELDVLRTLATHGG